MNTDYNVRLEHISVKKLFNLYDYELDFSNPVSIIIAPNGYGKTTIFHLINATLAADIGSLNVLRNVPFEEFTCTLSDDSHITLARSTNTTASSELNMVKDAIKYGINYYFRISTYYSAENGVILDKPEEYSFNYLDGYEEYALGGYEDRGHCEESKLIRYNLQSNSSTQKTYLTKTKCLCPIFFVTANRLAMRKVKPSNRFPRNGLFSDANSEFETVNPLDLANEDIGNKVRLMKKGYEKLKAEAQNSLPSRFLCSNLENYPCYEQFMNKWNEYIHHLNEFHALGFIDDDISSSLFDISKKDYISKAAFLNVYLDSFSSTIEPLFIYYDDFRLFKEILDSRNQITGKTVSFTEDGVIFHFTDSDRALKLSSLSSGEKNDFIMFYNLLFKAKDHGIVLIDEPEISLHIELQESFIDNLKDIARKNKLQALVATHSPHIINGYFNLIKEL